MVAYSGSSQWKKSSMLREIVKAYSGFSVPSIILDLKVDSVFGKSIATGNWGCGAFGGNAKLKFILQWIAASLAKRDLVYCTFKSREVDGIERVINGAKSRYLKVKDLVLALESCCELENSSVSYLSRDDEMRGNADDLWKIISEGN